MPMRERLASAIGAAAIGSFVLSGTASADIVASYGFTDLSSSFEIEEGGSGNGLWIADAIGTTSGDVTRASGGTALFNPGDIDGDAAAVHFEISVENIDGVGLTADGAGSFYIIDADGDMLSGTFSGVWIGGGFGFTFQNSTGIDWAFDGANGNGTFDGPSGGSFSYDDLGTLIGALTIVFQQPGMGFFDEEFIRVSAQAEAVMIVPAPGALALAGLGLGLAGVRRRR